MNRSRIARIVLSVAIAAAVLGVASPVAAAVDRASIAVSTKYLIKANLSFAAGTISATERIVVTNRSGARISKLNLSVMPRAFGELTSISKFSVDGVAVSARWTNNSNLELQLGRQLADGATATVRLAFSVRASGTIGTSLEGRLSKANGIMQVSHWFPIVSDGHETRYPGDSQYTRAAKKIRVELTTDSSSVRIAAPGTLVSSSGRTHVYEMLNTRDFAFGASPHYLLARGSAAGVAVSAYYVSGSGASAVANAISALVKYEAAYGQYQWSRFVIAQTGRSGSGNEYPGIIFLGGRLLTDRAVVAHEMAHQWWYAMAGNNQLREPWLDEGLAEFSATYFFGTFDPYLSSRPVNSSVYEFPNLPAPTTSTDPDSYNQTIYFKSAAFLNGLRVRMGTSRFFEGMRALFAANRNGVVTSREFYDTMARYGAPTSYMSGFIRF
jgi:hypothetical protein